MHVFQKHSDPEKGISTDDPQLRHSNIITYTGIDKREGLVAIAKRLLRRTYHFFRIQIGPPVDLQLSRHCTLDVDCGSLSVSWQKTWHEDDKMNRSRGSDTVALSAFMLSALPNGQARRGLVKEMWESGAEVMVSTFLLFMLQ
jgi:hypothetical protein